MASRSKEEGCNSASGIGRKSKGALKLGQVATASAVLGGLAVAWWYRDTLHKIQNLGNSDYIPKSVYSESEFPDAAVDESAPPGPVPLPHLTQD